MNYKDINDISQRDVGSQIYVIAQVKGVRQTSGPTVFELRDNTGHIKATAFSRAGERAFPDIMPGDNIQALATVKERQGALELEIGSYEKTSQQVISVVDLTKKPFLIQSGILDRMRPDFIKAAGVIREAIAESRPIYIRHHDDTDGYSSGLALEKAVRPLIEEATDKPYLYLARSSSRTPYYDYTDALRDLNTYVISKSRADVLPPLIILCDLGSNCQSIKAIDRLLTYGIRFLIVDHHAYDDANVKAVEVFLNPQAYGYGSDMNSGSLATELALFINTGLQGIAHFPALSGTADKSDGDEYERYVRLSGYDKDYLKKWSLFIDHETYYLKFQESSELLEDLFMPGENNTDLIRQIVPSVEDDFKKINVALRKFAEIKDMGGFKVLSVNKEQVASYGDYASSKITRLCHELADGPRITMAISQDAVSFRADGVPGFSVIKLLSHIIEKAPYSLAEGGGHDYAGNISFNMASANEVRRIIWEYLAQISR